MNWLLDHFQIVLVIAVAIAAWIKKRAEATKADDAPRDTAEDWPVQPETWTPSPAPAQPARRVRKVMPQPPPRQQAVAPEVEALLARQTAMQERLHQIKETKAAVTKAKKAAKIQPNSGKSQIRTALRDRQQLRRAIILREVLGPPAGLR